MTYLFLPEGNTHVGTFKWPNCVSVAASVCLICLFVMTTLLYLTHFGVKAVHQYSWWPHLLIWDWTTLLTSVNSRHTLWQPRPLQIFYVCQVNWGRQMMYMLLLTSGGSPQYNLHETTTAMFVRGGNPTQFQRTMISCAEFMNVWKRGTFPVFTSPTSIRMHVLFNWYID